MAETLTLNDRRFLKLEQVQLLYESMSFKAVVNIVCAIVLVAIEWSAENQTILNTWFILLLIITLGRYVLAHLYRLASPESKQRPFWETFFITGVILSGATWGSATVIFFPEASFEHQFFLSLIICGVCIAAINTLSPLLLPVLIFLFLAMTPLISQLLISAETLINEMGYLLTLFLLMISVSAFRTNRNIENNVKVQIQSEQLKDTLLETKLRLQFITDHAPVGIWMVGTDGCFHFANKTFCDAVGISENDSLGATKLSELLGDKVAERWTRSNRECMEQGGMHHSQELIPFTDGKQHLLDITRVKAINRQGTVEGVIGISLDITQHVIDCEKLKKFSQAIEQAEESVIITDNKGIIEYVNPSFTKITGFLAEEVMGKNPRILKSGNQTPEYYKNMWSTITSGNTWRSSLIDRRKDGSQYPAIITISPIFSDDGKITHYIGTQQDMTENKLLEDQFYQAQKNGGHRSIGRWPCS